MINLQIIYIRLYAF